MAKDQLSRKLAVILHADVVGSTSLVQKNETLAHERIQDTFNKFSKTISDYGGIAREIRGDALVAEFERASDAVASAMVYQALNGELNAAVEDEIQPQLRIGISLGEVIIADNTITGAGVVLPQRLEQLADPGVVVVQGSVSETVPTRMPFTFESMGEQVVKGFDQPIRAFFVSLRPGEEFPAPDAASISELAERDHLEHLSKHSPDSYQALIGERLEISDQPSIAVLPFQNMSGDPEQEYFSDGMSEDIITALSRVPDLIVIARNSTFVYKGRAVDIRQVGQELGVRFVLEGSIRKSGNRIRITAQIVDTLSGDHVWAERYDRKLDDIFAVQDEITHRIVIELHVKLVTGEYSRRWASGTESIEAWELVIRSNQLLDSQVRDKSVVAKQMLNRALEIDNRYYIAWALLGWAYWQESAWEWSADSEKSMQKAFEAAQKALAINPQHPDGLSLLGHVYMSRDDAEQAIEMCERAAELAPSDSETLALLGIVLVLTDRVKRGIQKLQSAIRLNPFPPTWFLSALGAGYHLDGDNETAISLLEQAAEREPDTILHRLWLINVHVEMGKVEEAGMVAKEVLNIDPTFTAISWSKGVGSGLSAQFTENLITAGIPV